MTETSRARSSWHEESNNIATVLNSIHQNKIPAHMLNRSRSAYKMATSMSQTVSTSIPLRTSAILKTKEAKDFSKSEAELVDVMDTHQT